MKLCDIQVGMLVKTKYDNKVSAVVGVVLKHPNDPETCIVLECECPELGRKLKTYAYPSELTKLTEDDL